MAVVFCVVLTSAVILRLAWLQIVNQEFYEQKALSSQTRDVTIYPTRGTIYDAKGKPLAISASTEMLIINPRQLRPEESADLSDAERILLGFELEPKYTMTDQQKDTVKNYRIELLVSELPNLLEGLDGETVRAKATKDSAYQVLMRGVEKDQAAAFCPPTSSPADCISPMIPPAIIPTAAFWPTCWAAWAPTSRASPGWKKSLTRC